VYVAKLKGLKEAKKTGVTAPIATQLSGIVIHHRHKGGSWPLLIPLPADAKAQARKQSVCSSYRLTGHSREILCREHVSHYYDILVTYVPYHYV
jgi:hypothetical protein